MTSNSDQTTPSRAVLGFVAPLLPVADMARAVAVYTALGFQVDQPTPDYARAVRDGISLHLALNEDHDPGVGAACVYVGVDDPDVLAAEWAAAGVEVRITAPVDRIFGFREGALFDSDNNLIRFGRPL